MTLWPSPINRQQATLNRVAGWLLPDTISIQILFSNHSFTGKDVLQDIYCSEAVRFENGLIKTWLFNKLLLIKYSFHSGLLFTEVSSSSLVFIL